jgi:N-acetylneuraminic acid mutarotase
MKRAISLVAAILLTLSVVAPVVAARASPWSATGSMGISRSIQTATLLLSGKVLVVGGQTAGGLTAEVYDPVAGTWTATPNMPDAHMDWHTATRLMDGKVLVVGGISDYAGTKTAAADLYDPGLGTWSTTGSLSVARYGHAATLLRDGRVLVTGGDSGPTALETASAEIYDPLTGSWTTAASMATARTYHTSTRLLDGRVLVAGGRTTTGSAEVYDPASGAWATVGSMHGARLLHSATLLPAGTVLVAGGTSNGSTYLATAELYNPVTGMWATVGSMASARLGHTATLLSDGRVLVAGGQANSTGGLPLASSELYPATKKGMKPWQSAGDMATGRTLHTATLLLSGKVLVCGGIVSTGRTATCEIYTPRR